MGYRERIEKAVIQMFNAERELEEIMERDRPTYELGWNGPCDIALDLLCVPKDNTLDYDYNNPALNGKWPEGCFCRDSFMNEWFQGAESGEQFVKDCYKFLKEYAEERDKKQY